MAAVDRLEPLLISACTARSGGVLQGIASSTGHRAQSLGGLRAHVIYPLPTPYPLLNCDTLATGPVFLSIEIDRILRFLILKLRVSVFVLGAYLLSILPSSEHD